MPREPQVPLSAVKLFVDQQNDFNKALVELLGQYLERASVEYRNALNPPLEVGDGPAMTYSSMSEEEEQLQYSMEAGLIDPSDYNEALRRLTKDTQISLE